MPKDIHRDVPLKHENEKVIFDNVEMLKKLKEGEDNDKDSASHDIELS